MCSAGWSFVLCLITMEGLWHSYVLQDLCLSDVSRPGQQTDHVCGSFTGCSYLWHGDYTFDNEATQNHRSTIRTTNRCFSSPESLVKQLSRTFSIIYRPGSSQTVDWATGAAVVQIDARRCGRSTSDTHECRWSGAGIVYRFIRSVYQRRKATAVLQRTHYSYVLRRCFGLMWKRKWNWNFQVGVAAAISWASAIWQMPSSNIKFSLLYLAHEAARRAINYLWLK